MVELDDTHMQRIICWVEDYHLKLDVLKEELIDHIACEIEWFMRKGLTFNEAFDKTIDLIPEGQLVKIEEASLYLINYKFRIMKQITVFSGLLVLLIFISVFFIQFFQPELVAEFLLAAMIILSAVFIPLFFITNYRNRKEEKQKILHILGFSGAFLVSTSTVLSYFEIRFSGTSIITGLLLLLTGFFPMFLLNVRQKENMKLAQGTLLLFFFISILAVGFYNVSISKDMTDYWWQQGEEILANNGILEKISKSYITRSESENHMENKI